MKRLWTIILIFLLSIQSVFSAEMANLDADISDEPEIQVAENSQNEPKYYDEVIEFQKNDSSETISLKNDSLFKIQVEKNVPYSSMDLIRGIDEPGRINIYDQKTYRHYDRGVTDKTIALDENTNVIIGSHNLYSALGPTVTFIKRESTYGESGATFVRKGEYINFSAAVYNASESTGNTGGAVISTAPIKLPAGELIVGSAVYNTNLSAKETMRYGFFGQFRHKRFKLNTQISKYKPNSSLDLEANTIFLSPEIALTDSLSISAGLQNDITNKKTRSELSLNYHPVKSDRNLELEITLTNFAEPRNASVQQRMYLGTKFKI